MRDGRFEVGDRLIFRDKDPHEPHFIVVQNYILDQNLAGLIEAEIRHDYIYAGFPFLQVISKNGKSKEYKIQKSNETIRWVLANLKLLAAEQELRIYKPEMLAKLEDCL